MIHFEKGYKRYYELEALDLIKLNDFKLLNAEERQRDNGEKDVSLYYTKRLNLFGHYLHQKYIIPEWNKSEYLYYNVWDGVDKDNQGWHTDFMEGYDVFFLYYFDTDKYRYRW